MHYSCEIIIPPNNDVRSAVAQILAPFDENGRDEYGEPNRYAFWDFYVIGGRYAGRKTEAFIDPAELAEFYAWMKANKVLVQGFVSGKQTLADIKTERLVDDKWRAMFPGKGEKCILFSHSNDQYHEALPGDICRLGDAPETYKASRVIIAGLQYSGRGLEAKFMVETEYYNGVSHLDTEWNGNVRGAVAAYISSAWRSQPEWREKNMPTDDWMAITVDYHS